MFFFLQIFRKKRDVFPYFLMAKNLFNQLKIIRLINFQSLYFNDSDLWIITSIFNQEGNNILEFHIALQTMRLEKKD